MAQAEAAVDAQQRLVVRVEHGEVARDDAALLHHAAEPRARAVAHDHLVAREAQRPLEHEERRGRAQPRVDAGGREPRARGRVVRRERRGDELHREGPAAAADEAREHARLLDREQAELRAARGRAEHDVAVLGLEAAHRLEVLDLLAHEELVDVAQVARELPRVREGGRGHPGESDQAKIFSSSSFRWR